MLTVGLIALALCVPPAAAKHKDSREHISEYSDSPTHLTIPELTPHSPGYHALSQLPEGAAVAVTHSFLGITDVGHVDFKFDAVRKLGSVHTDDYAGALARAAFACSRADRNRSDDDAPPARAEDGSRIRRDLLVTITFPDAPEGAIDAEEAHFLRALRAPDAYLSFDQALHATHPDFKKGTRCSKRVPWEHATFSVTDAADVPGGIALTLSPALPKSAHHMLRTRFRWDPDTDREVARRRAAGLPVGVDARRRLKKVNLGSMNMGMNWNGDAAAPAAANATIELVSGTPGLLTCVNCFAYVQAVYNIEFDFCLGINILNFIYFYTANDMSGAITNEDLLWGWRAKSAKAALTAENMEDCTAAYAPWAAAAEGNKDGDWVPEQTAPLVWRAPPPAQKSCLRAP